MDTNDSLATAISFLTRIFSPSTRDKLESDRSTPWMASSTHWLGELINFFCIYSKVVLLEVDLLICSFVGHLPFGKRVVIEVSCYCRI